MNIAKQLYNFLFESSSEFVETIYMYNEAILVLPYQYIVINFFLSNN